MPQPRPRGRPKGSDDPDQLFLDNNIALAADIRQLVEEIKEICDEPAILHLVLKIEAAALITQLRTKNYRKHLKTKRSVEGRTSIRGTDDFSET